MPENDQNEEWPPKNGGLSPSQFLVGTVAITAYSLVVWGIIALIGLAILSAIFG